MPEGPEIARSVELIIEQIPTVGRRLGIDANGGWTLLIKEQLAQLGDALDYEVRTSGAAPADADQPPNWRYDLTWLQLTSGGTQIARVPLVLESEWHSSREEQRQDFQELLAVPAELRVLVFHQRNAAAVQDVMDELEEATTGRTRNGLRSERLRSDTRSHETAQDVPGGPLAV